MNKPLHQLTIAESAHEIASGAVSPVELTEACLGVIETHDAEVNAFLDVTADLARAQARAAEEEIRRIGPRSPMHGVPFALKDIYDTRGIATTGHSALYRQRIPAEDQLVPSVCMVPAQCCLANLLHMNLLQAVRHTIYHGHPRRIRGCGSFPVAPVVARCACWQRVWYRGPLAAIRQAPFVYRQRFAVWPD